MRPNEFIGKYQTIKNGTKFNHSDFVNDLADDFRERIKYYAEMKGTLQYRHFKIAITEIKQKFDAISRKSLGDPDKWNKIWNFFFAAVVVPERSKQFPDWKAPTKPKHRNASKDLPVTMGSFGEAIKFVQALNFLKDHKEKTQPTGENNAN